MTAFDRYIEPATLRPGIWRMLVGVVVIAACWILGMVAVLSVWTAINIAKLGATEPALERLGQLMTGGNATGVLIMLMSFCGVWAGVWIVLRLLHAQPFRTVFAPDRHGASRDFLFGIGIAAVFAGISVLAAGTVVLPERTEVSLSDWLLLLVPVVALVFVQATAEELIFRGYLLQQLAVRSQSPMIWAVVPSLLFGLMHYSGDLPGNTEVYYVVITALTGIALAVLVWKTGRLWAAAGLHVGINALNLTLIGADGVLTGTQLWLFPASELERLMQVDLAASALLLLYVLSPFCPRRRPADTHAQ